MKQNPSITTLNLLGIKKIKKTWESINDVMNKSKIQSTFPSYFNINGTKLTDKKDIATEFNIFFINIGPKPVSEIGNDMENDFSFLTRFNKIATQGAPQMAVDEEANSLSRVYSYYSKFNLRLFYV